MTTTTYLWVVMLWLITVWIFHRFFAFAVALYIMRPLIYLFLYLNKPFEYIATILLALAKLALIIKIKLTRVAFPQAEDTR